ncbi:MAG: hypothetical protein M1831_002934 [Alyxoria varia]|nr:MAG: hypothetical protein M1831_002934 [Alyxoria varia]
MSEDNTLDPQDEEWLRSNNVALRQGASIRISRRRFQKSSTESDESETPFSPTSAAGMSSATTSPPPPGDEVTIPYKLHSVETYQFLGLDHQTSSDLFHRWTGMAEDVRQVTSFIQFGIDRIKYNSINAATINEDWDDILRRMGVNGQLRSAIVKPGFDEIRLMRSAREWVILAMKMRGDFLQTGQEASRQRGMELRSGRAVRGQARSGPSRRSDSPTTSYTFASGSGRMFPPQGDQPGDTILWQSTCRVWAESMWPGARREGLWQLAPLVSPSPTDFNGRHAMFYFTNQVEGAKFYLRYLRDIDNAGGVCLVRVAVPNRIIENAQPFLLHFPSDTFKKTIWFSRRGQPLKGNVDEVAGHKLLIGHTCRGDARTFHQMSSWTEVSEHNLVYLNGPRGHKDSYMTQFVFGEALEDEINRRCQQKLSIRHAEHQDMTLPSWNA